jgi:DNA-binding MarR family transcriptional regulator
MVMTVRKTDDLSALFTAMVDGYKECTSAVAKKFNLYAGQTQVLFFLDEKTGWTQKELAGQLRVSKATMGVSLRRMEKAGLIDRKTDPVDARCIRVSLTDKGREICQKCQDAYSVIYGDMFGDAKSEARPETHKVLKKLLEGLAAAHKKLIKK